MQVLFTDFVSFSTSLIRSKKITHVLLWVKHSLKHEKNCYNKAFLAFGIGASQGHYVISTM